MAHIVKTEPGEDAASKVLEARIYGTPLEALCGHVWIPSRDPKQLPLCDKCKEIYETYRMFNDGLNERPSEELTKISGSYFGTHGQRCNVFCNNIDNAAITHFQSAANQ